MSPKSDGPGGARASVFRRLMGVGFVRRTYAKRLIKFMERSKRKSKPLPPELREVARAMDQLPEAQRLPTLEQALQGKGGPESMSREMRRAASRQTRMSGKGGPHRRPGAMRTRDPVAPAPKAPPAARAAPTKTSKAGPGKQAKGARPK
jgi:hypothetical protein